MSNNSQSERWTLNSTEHPQVLVALSSSELARKWYDELEDATNDDYVTGKVLCVVAGIAIAKEVVLTKFQEHSCRAEAVQLLDLADAWVDDPTNERFDQITEFLFDDDREFTNDNPLRVVWGALRIATSCVGAKEAAWALSMVDDHANIAGLDAVAIARNAVESRST